MSPAELEIKSILLKERSSLIQAGHQRKSIRINSQTKKIYLNNQVYGKIKNSKFVHSTQHSAPSSSSNSQPHASQPSVNQESLITLASPTPTANDTTNTTKQVQWLGHVCYLNIRSIVNKINILQSFVYSRFPDIIGVTEIWLSDKLFDSKILPHDYSIIRKYHQSRGGGVMVAIKHSKSYQVFAFPIWFRNTYY